MRQLHILGRPPIVYNLLSIDTGITPDIDDIVGARQHAIAVKPVSTFAPRWKALEARALEPGGPRRIVVVGTGAAGFELVLAIRHRLCERAPLHGLRPDAFTFTLIGSGGLLPTHNMRARALATQELEGAGIALVSGDAVVGVGPSHVRLSSGRQLPSDATLITTKAAPPAWFRQTGLSLDASGFLAVRDTLQVEAEDDIFAVGDCATVIGHPREKAGVFAVRQGPPLTINLRRRARGMAPEPFSPQRHFLTLLSCGNRSAIAARGRFAAAGKWAWRLKDHIDREFMRRFQELPRPEGPSDDMLCAGCAAKLGPAPLTRALSRHAASLPAASSADRVHNLLPGDDAAVLDLGGAPLRLESIDHFPALWPEPYVLGEIAAAHAMSDVLAKGGTPDHALALAGLPPAASHLQEDDLVQLLAGATAVFAPAGVALVGGHTARAADTSIGFFVSGTVERNRLLPKAGLRPGQLLVLTKPLGTGIVFAGWMRRIAHAREVSAALTGMRSSNATATRVLLAQGATAATDVTGFGLAGHLVEMLEASSMAATIALPACPRYDGVDRLLALGVRSSLIPDNLALSDRLDLDCDAPEQALALLFDPQTSGGILASIPAAAADDVIRQLGEAGVGAAVVGVVRDRTPADAGRILKVLRDGSFANVVTGSTRSTGIAAQ